MPNPFVVNLSGKEDTVVGENPGCVPHRRQITLISGNGKGPTVPFRSSSAEIRIRGLTSGSKLIIHIDNNSYDFDKDGTFKVSGGQLARAVVHGDSIVFCDLITE